MYPEQKLNTYIDIKLAHIYLVQNKMQLQTYDYNCNINTNQKQTRTDHSSKKLTPHPCPESVWTLHPVQLY